MIVLSFDLDTARRIVNGEQTVVTYPGVDGFATYLRASDGVMVPLTDLVGQTVAVARLGSLDVDSVGRAFAAALDKKGTGAQHLRWEPGAIVGSATVAAVQQRVGEDRGQVGWAVILTDAAPCEQRCPWCRGTGIGDLLDRTYCEQCHGSQMAWPIPYDQPGPISEWSPS